MPTIRWIEGEDMFGRWSGAWAELCGDAENATPFQTVEWQRTWFGHFGGRKRPLALAAFEGDDLTGWWPLVRSTGSWPVLRPMGKGPSDYLHPIVRRGARGVGAAMANELRESGSALVDLHQLRGDFAEALLGHLSQPQHEPIPQAECLVLELDQTYPAYVQGLGKSLRYDVRRLEKPPFTTGVARIELASETGVGQALESLFRLHAMRWRRRWQPGAFPANLRRFHLEWAALAQSKGWLELSLLLLEGEPIGALYAMTLNGSTFYYQAGMDPAQNSISPGTLLVADAIRRAIERGDRRFDFLRGDEAYKRRWKPQHAYTNYRYVLPGSGARSAVGARWNRMGSRIEAKVRARLEAR
ncbi:MAG TPA: GNAT family N-acetyltransferase [Fimbriimonadaceae bacterium]|nr:GNAT family N-acetyltransferase [Fimbriimonadaceae bacterium]